jgi:predicted glycogen debranching enzyme
MSLHSRSEWLEADGLGGFASGTVDGIRTRRYHALLLVASNPPTGRLALVNGFDATVETEGGSYPITSQRYEGDVVSPDGYHRLDGFEVDPWPRFTIALEDGTRLRQEIFVPLGHAAVVVTFKLLTRGRRASLTLRPFLSGRDYHALHHENGDFRFAAEVGKGRVAFRTYDSVPGVVALSNGAYREEPHWYRSFVYDEERARGLDFVEDLAAPGVFRFELTKKEATLVFHAPELGAPLPSGSAEAVVDALRSAERGRRAGFPTRLHRSADSYLVKRGRGQTLVAGYPWFTDWGRDTFVALRGLCLATGRLEEARDILLEWAHAVSDGMLPNRFPDRPEQAPEYNSVDAALWFVVAGYEYLQLAKGTKGAEHCTVCQAERGCFKRAALAILDGYRQGTRHGIRMDDDGLLAAGETGVQLTWMDAKVGDWVVTPRIGKPVEVQALWLNALRIGSELDARWRSVLERALRAFSERFWDEERGFLADVVDEWHVRGAVDRTFRPNQIFAVGGLPFPVVTGDRARRIVDAVEDRLLTPLGLRSLARDEPGYVGRYEGGVRERDGAYHRGTVWPWLLGGFVDAWVRVRGGTAQAKKEARRRFLEPLLRHVDEAGLGHVSEIADGDAPHEPRGCPFQAWSVGEALRIDRVVLQIAVAPRPEAAQAPKGRSRPTSPESSA